MGAMRSGDAPQPSQAESTSPIARAPRPAMPNGGIAEIVGPQPVPQPSVEQPEDDMLVDDMPAAETSNEGQQVNARSGKQKAPTETAEEKARRLDEAAEARYQRAEDIRSVQDENRGWQYLKHPIRNWFRFRGVRANVNEKVGDVLTWRSNRAEHAGRGAAARKLLDRDEMPFGNAGAENLSRWSPLSPEARANRLESRRQKDLELARQMGVTTELVGVDGAPLPDLPEDASPEDREIRRRIVEQTENMTIALGRAAAREARARADGVWWAGWLGIKGRFNATERGTMVGEEFRPQVLARVLGDGTVRMSAVMFDGTEQDVLMNEKGELEFFPGQTDQRDVQERVARAHVTSYSYNPKNEQLRYVHNQFEEDKQTDIIDISSKRRRIRSEEVTQAEVRRDMERQMSDSTILTAVLLSGGRREGNLSAIFVEHGVSDLVMTDEDGVTRPMTEEEIYDEAERVVRSNPQYRGIGTAVIDYQGAQDINQVYGGVGLLEMGDIDVANFGQQERRASLGEPTEETEVRTTGKRVEVYLTAEDLKVYEGLDAHAQAEFRKGHGEVVAEKPEDRTNVVVRVRTPRAASRAEVRTQMEADGKQLKAQETRYKDWEQQAKDDDVLPRAALRDPALRLLKLDHEGIEDLRAADSQVQEIRDAVGAAVEGDTRRSKLLEARRILRERFSERLADDNGELAKSINELAMTMYPDEKPTLALLDDEKRSSDESRDKYRERLTGLYREVGGDPDSIAGKAGIDAMVEASITPDERTAYVEKAAFNLRSVAHADLEAAIAERDRLLGEEPNPALKKAIEEAFEHEYGEEQRAAEAKAKRSVVDILTRKDSTVGEREEVEATLDSAGYIPRSQAERDRMADDADFGKQVRARLAENLLTNQGPNNRGGNNGQ